MSYQISQKGLVLNLSNIEKYEARGSIIRDKSRQRNDGTIYGAKFQNFAGYGQALSFDGTNDYINCGNDASLDVTDVTIESWVKENVSEGYPKIASRRNGLNFYFLGTDNGYPYGGIGNGSSYTTITKDTAMPTGEWHHLAFVFIDAQNHGWLYYDGELTNDGAINEGIGNLSGINLSIGADSQGSTNYFNGLIAITRIYNRALLADEVRNNMYASWIYKMQRGIKSE